MKTLVLYSVVGRAVSITAPCWIAMDSDGEVYEYAVNAKDDIIQPYIDGTGDWNGEKSPEFLFTEKDPVVIERHKESLRFVDSFGVIRKPVTTFVAEETRIPLEKDTWYWMGNPSEGDIFYPVYSLGTYIRVDNKVHQLSEVEGATFEKAKMPGDK